jgi:hypothetical protein
MGVEKTGATKSLGSVTYTSWDGYVTEASFALDSASPPACWRKMTVGKGSSGEATGESAINYAGCKGMLDSYATTYKARVTGDPAGILKKIPQNVVDPIAMAEAEKAAQQEAMAAADY